MDYSDRCCREGLALRWNLKSHLDLGGGMSDQGSFHLFELIKLTYKFSRVLIYAGAPTDNRFINQNVHLVYSTVAPFQ